MCLSKVINNQQQFIMNIDETYQKIKTEMNKANYYFNKQEEIY